MAKYLDKSGVTYLWNKIKGLFTDQSLNTKNKTYAGAINEINTKVGNLTGAFLWKGKFDTLPAVTDYEAGNVVGVGKKEYVLTVTEGTKAWEEFGDEGSYLLKTTAEETYLKKAAGEVKTTNLADNAVTSTKLAEGARNPIIITEDMTEVDEETYQKLLSDDVDVIFKTNLDNYCVCTYKEAGCIYYFTTLSIEGTELMDIYLYGYEVSINNEAPHKVTIKELYVNDIFTLIDKFVNKSILSPVLQEIDLIGTDEERKAKLDQFETDWKALTGASDLRGARFVGYVDNTDNSGNCSVLFTFDHGSNVLYQGCAMASDTDKKIVRYTLDKNDGSLVLTPLFSHLEAVTIKTDNSTASKAANVAAIKAYIDNLTALGVDVTKGYMIPCKFPNSVAGVLSAVSSSLIVAITTNGRGELNCYEVYIGGDNPGAVYSIGGFQLKTSSDLTTTSKQIVGAINEVNALAKSKQDALTSGTNIKTVNGQSLLGSGDIAISGGGSGDVIKAGNNVFTGNNTFTTFVRFSRGIELTNANEEVHYYLDLDSNTNKFRISDDSDMDVEVTGVDTPIQNNSAANKFYVDSQISTALGTVLTQLQNI